MTTTPTNTALARTPTQDALASFGRMTRDAGSVAAALERAQAVGHLVAPATSVSGGLPEGMSVAISAVLVDERETYPIPGSSDRGLSRVALDRIAMAAAIDWNPVLSRRLDDGHDPHFVHYCAVGSVRSFDGSTITITGERVYDARDKAPAIESLWSKYREKLADWKREGERGPAPKSPESAIRELRAHLLSHCATRARNRAIRSLGLRAAYSREALAKPFLVARLSFTGEASTPELTREFAIMRAASFLGARAALYGAAPAPMLPPAQPAPPVGQVVDHDPDGVVVDAEFEASIDAPAAAPASWSCTCGVNNAAARATCCACDLPRDGTPPVVQAPAPTAASSPSPRQTSNVGQSIMKFGRSKGQRLCDAPEDDVQWYANAIRSSIDDPEKSRWRSQNVETLRECEAELARREGGDVNGEPGDDFEASGRAGRDDDDIPF